MSAVIVCLSLAGCGEDRPESPATPEGIRAHDGGPAAFVAQETTINNYHVHFDGRSFANNQTTFTYTVSGTGVDPSLSHFAVELPSCAPAPVSWSPTGSANINTNQETGIYGLEWHLSVAKDNFTGRTYSITFPGDVPLGTVRAEVKTEGGNWGVGDVYGPCAGFHISGTVFVDADSNGVQAPSEGGIDDVTVTITDGVATQTTMTDVNGNYTFVVLAGTYTVSIDPATAATDFNEDLFSLFTAKSPTSIGVTVGPSADDQDFAFATNTKKIISSFDTGALTTAGKPIRFWKLALKTAISGDGKSVYTADELLFFIQQIQAFGLPTPFQFTSGNELQEAFAIFKDNTNTDLTDLTQELLAAEFNLVSGRTLVGEADLHAVLVLWGEELVLQAQTTAAPASSFAPGSVTGIGEGLSDGIIIFGQINGATGGGGTNE